MKNSLKILFLLLVNVWYSNAQGLPVPKSIGNSHPRIFGATMTVNSVKQLANEKQWAQDIIDKTKEKLDPYLELYKRDKNWLVSRLQMNWKTKANQVYINGGTFARVEGEAPVPTVKFPGARNHITEYKQPALEDIKPYMDDSRGLYLEKKDQAGIWEWTGISKTGKIVETVNRQILGLSRDAAFLYWYTGDEVYARFAYDVLDTYLMGIYYLKEPIDLSHGHHQTLVGFTSFEVIQEHILGEICQSYDFLYNYMKVEYPDKLAVYSSTLQKWADQIVKNGVSFNNWNLLEALHISKIALVLDDNSNYANGKGGTYYLDQIMNKSSTRQWSMNKLIDYGYDTKTGIWNESPGYSQNVLNDFVHFAQFYDRTFDIDLLKDLPVLSLSAKSFAQYLYPNKYMVAFGDGHYKKMSSETIMYMIENAQKYGKKDDELYFTKMLKTIFEKDIYSGKFSGKQLEDLFAKEPAKIRGDIQATNLYELMSPLFYAPNTSWLVQRQIGGEKELMISQIGSFGNHMHSNGIAMELYGYGVPLAPEMGHGSSYFSIEYGEYYTQFPAHNTVAVNGRSKYPEMKSNHAFTTNSFYPESGNKEGNFQGLTFSDVSFLEPETNSNQRRVMGILDNDKGTGYYIDIFRSKQNTGNNIKHDYFYHNLGQSFSLVDEQNNSLQLNPTSKLAFGDGDLMAYDYMWDKKSIETNQNFKGQFSLKTEDKTVSMNLWMKGETNREIFSALSPASTALSDGIISKELAMLPTPTMVVRQNGEAWNKPFVAIYEPALNGNSSIQSVNYFGKEELVGIQVNSKNGQQDFIFSNTQLNTPFQYKKMQVLGTYGVIAVDNGKLKSLFLADGTFIEDNEYSLKANANTTVAFTFEENNWGYMAKNPVELQIPLIVKNNKVKLILKNGQKQIEGKIKKVNQKEVVVFKLPANEKFTKVTVIISNEE
jgi:hypothetical protein